MAPPFDPLAFVEAALKSVSSALGKLNISKVQEAVLGTQALLLALVVLLVILVLVGMLSVYIFYARPQWPSLLGHREDILEELNDVRQLVTVAIRRIQPRKGHSDIVNELANNLAGLGRMSVADWTDYYRYFDLIAKGFGECCDAFANQRRDTLLELDQVSRNRIEDLGRTVMKVRSSLKAAMPAYSDSKDDTVDRALVALLYQVLELEHEERSKLFRSRAGLGDKRRPGSSENVNLGVRYTAQVLFREMLEKPLYCQVILKELRKVEIGLNPKAFGQHYKRYLDDTVKNAGDGAESMLSQYVRNFMGPPSDAAMENQEIQKGFLSKVPVVGNLLGKIPGVGGGLGKIPGVGGVLGKIPGVGGGLGKLPFIEGFKLKMPKVIPTKPSAIKAIVQKPATAIAGGKGNPLAAIAGGKGNPLAAIAGGKGNPLAAITGGKGNPLAAIAGGKGNPLAAIAGGKGNPLALQGLGLGGGGVIGKIIGFLQTILRVVGNVFARPKDAAMLVLMAIVAGVLFVTRVVLAATGLPVLLDVVLVPVLKILVSGVVGVVLGILLVLTLLVEVLLRSVGAGTSLLSMGRCENLPGNWYRNPDGGQGYERNVLCWSPCPKGFRKTKLGGCVRRDADHPDFCPRAQVIRAFRGLPPGSQPGGLRVPPRFLGGNGDYTNRLQVRARFLGACDQSTKQYDSVTKAVCEGASGGKSSRDALSTACKVLYCGSKSHRPTFCSSNRDSATLLEDLLTQLDDDGDDKAGTQMLYLVLLFVGVVLLVAFGILQSIPSSMKAAAVSGIPE
jgi:hypothetical protein